MVMAYELFGLVLHPQGQETSHEFCTEYNYKMNKI